MKEEVTAMTCFEGPVEAHPGLGLCLLQMKHEE